MSLLLARDLSVTPPGAGAPAVARFSIAVGRGEWVAVTGRNGGGKTSLLLGLAGLWPADGELRLEGEPFGPRTGAGPRRRVAVVMQDPSSQLLQPTVGDEIAFAARNLGLPADEVRRRVSDVGGRLGLSRDLERDPARLSAGRQQLVIMAAALAAEPDLLLADEATAHMDPAARGSVLALVGERVARGLAAIWVTQVGEELRLATRCVTVGEPDATGTPPAPRELKPSWERRATIAVSPISAVGSSTAAGSGPMVMTDRPIEIGIGSTGIIGITGPNAAGKSAILMAAAGIETVPQVEVRWHGAPDHPPIAALQFPELQIFQEIVSDEMTFACVSRGMSRDAAAAAVTGLLEEVGIPGDEFMRRRTWGLCAGDKRVMEVLAAIASPACLHVLDEPTAGLDPARRSAMGRCVVRAAARNSFLVATQDRGWMESLGCRVVEIGPPR